MKCPKCGRKLEESPERSYFCAQCSIHGDKEEIVQIKEILEKNDINLQQARKKVEEAEDSSRFIQYLIVIGNLSLAREILLSINPEIVCPKCSSVQVYVYDKEAYSSWSGNLKILKRETAEKKKFITRECKCYKCGHVFPLLLNHRIQKMAMFNP